MKSESKSTILSSFSWGKKGKEKRQVRRYKEAKGDLKYMNNQQMHFNIYDVFYSQSPHQNVSAGIPFHLQGMLLLQEYKRTNVVKCVSHHFIPIKIIISLKIV